MLLLKPDVRSGSGLRLLEALLKLHALIRREPRESRL
jgi:hypothetical protein